MFQLMAQADIIALPSLTITCFMRRSFLTPVVYTLLLWFRYHSASGSKYHQMVWQKFDSGIGPYVRKAPPQVQKARDFVVKKWTAPPGRAAAAVKKE
jgi:Transmembrane protein 33/Nucleoporin POM33